MTADKTPTTIAWSIPETCIWASTRDYAAVAAVAADPEEAYWLLWESLPIGHAAHVRDWQCIEMAKRGADRLPTPREALARIPVLASNEELPVYGVLGADGDFDLIPKAAWIGVEIRPSKPHGFIAARGLILSGGRWWSGLRVQRADAQKIWLPSVVEVTGGRGYSRANLEKAFVAWLETQAGIVIEADAHRAMEKELRCTVVRQEVRDLISTKVPAERRAPKHRPSGTRE